MHIKKQNKHGDLYVVYNINYPNKILSNEEKIIIKHIFPTNTLNLSIIDTLDVTPIKNNFLINDIYNKNGKRINNTFF